MKAFLRFFLIFVFALVLGTAMMLPVSASRLEKITFYVA